MEKETGKAGTSSGIERLQRRITELEEKNRDQRARLENRGQRLKLAKKAGRILNEAFSGTTKSSVDPGISKETVAKCRDLETEIRQWTSIFSFVNDKYLSGLPFPPEDLRLHVGTRTSLANFLSQGLSSSKRVIEIFGETPEGPILDWGCGSGRTLRWLYQHPVWREHYHGCDVDKDAVDWLQSVGISRVKVCGDSPPLPYDDGSFRGVFAFSVLTHIHPKHHRAWYKEFRRILAPNGLAYFTTNAGEIGKEKPGSILSSARSNLESNGWAWIKHSGHHKSAAIVNESFTRETVSDFFVIEDFRSRGYHLMDAFICRPRQ